MIKEFKVTFRLHQIGRESIKVPKDAVFIRLYYNPESWKLTLCFIYQEPEEDMGKRIIIFNNEFPGSRNHDRYLGNFMADQTKWHVYYE